MVADAYMIKIQKGLEGGAVENHTHMFFHMKPLYVWVGPMPIFKLFLFWNTVEL